MSNDDSKELDLQFDPLEDQHLISIEQDNTNEDEEQLSKEEKANATINKWLLNW